MNRTERLKPVYRLSVLSTLALLVPAVFSAAALPGGDDIPIATPTWPGSWYIDKTYPLATPAGVPAASEPNGRPAADGSERWSYEAITASAQRYTCSYEPIVGDSENVGRGSILVPTGPETGFPGECSMYRAPPESLLADYAVAEFFPEGYCFNGGYQAEPCSSLTDEPILRLNELGLFKRPDAVDPDPSAQALSAVGNWWWKAEHTYVRNTLHQALTMPEEAHIFIDPLSLDWVIQVEGGRLLCIQQNAFFFPHSMNWWPLSGNCLSTISHQHDARWINVTVEFPLGFQPGPFDDAFLTLAGGCANFLVTGEAGYVDASTLQDMLLEPDLYAGTDEVSIEWSTPRALRDFAFYQLDQADRCRA